MAKIPTSRIILYVVLGIVVIVVAVWMFRTRSQEARIGKRVVEPEDIPTEVKRLTKVIENLNNDIPDIAPEDQPAAQELIAKAQSALEEFQTLTTAEELTKKREEIQDYIKEVKKLKRLAKKKR